MRLTVNLEDDLYAVAKSLAKAEDCSISAAVNRLLRRALSSDAGAVQEASSPYRRSGFPVSRGTKTITADMVLEIDSEDDPS